MNQDLAAGTEGKENLDAKENASELTSELLNELIVKSENALAAKQLNVAVDVMNKAVKLAPGNAAMHYRLGLCLQLAGLVDEAEKQYYNAITCDKAHEGAYQSLIHAHIAKSDFSEAVRICREQERQCGKSPELSAQVVTLMVMAGRTAEALVLVEALNSTATDPKIDNLRLEAELSFRAGRADQAINAAHRALLAKPGDIGNFLALARFLCADQRYSSAIPLLIEALKLDPSDIEARSMLGVSQTESGRYEDALQTILTMIKQQPMSGRHWLLAATLANILGYRERAIGFLKLADKIDPDNVEVKTSLGNLLGSVGEFDEAVKLLDDAAALEPDNSSITDTKLHFLSERVSAVTPLNDTVSLILPLPRLTSRQHDRWRKSNSPGMEGFVHSTFLKGRVITGLILRELSHRSLQSKLGIASNLIEPLLQIVFLGLVLSIFNSGRPPLGDKLFFFYATGVLPFYLFLHVINYSINSFSDNQALLQVPLINRLDLVVATAHCEFLIGAATTTVIFIGFYVSGFAVYTDNIAEAIFAYAATFLFAFGVSLITSTLNNLNKMVSLTWQSVQRVLYIASGVFYLPQSMPVWVRDILAWNPLLHSIEWFRTGFFPQYAPAWLDKGYLLGSAACLIVFGLMLQKSLSRHMVNA